MLLPLHPQLVAACKPVGVAAREHVSFGPVADVELRLARGLLLLFPSREEGWVPMRPISGQPSDGLTSGLMFALTKQAQHEVVVEVNQISWQVRFSVRRSEGHAAHEQLKQKVKIAGAE